MQESTHEISKCPIHDCEPTCECKSIRDEINKTYLGADGQEKTYMLPMLRLHTVYCPHCKKAVEWREDEVTSQIISLSNGFSAVGSGDDAKLKAVDEWNSACAKIVIAKFNNVVSTGDEQV